MTMPNDRSRRVLLGEITTVHGVRGDIVVRPFTADPADIAAYGTLQAADGRPLPRLSIVRIAERRVIARLEGVRDRNAAEAYRGTELWVARDRLPPAAEGEYYHADLIGLIASTPEGDLVGEVIAVENFGAGDLLEIRLNGTRQTEYVPFTNDFAPTVDLAARTVTIIIPVADDEGGNGEPQEG